MAQKYSPLTPKLSDKHNVAVPGDVAVYGRADIGFLNSLSNGLAVEASAKNMDECGIPNAWARPLNFGTVLYRGEVDIELQKRVIGEWRGMLALLALRERIGIDVRCFQILLDNQSNKFLKAMRQICPPETYSLSPKDTTWDKVYVFTFGIGGKQNPIGMASPTTLVCTAAEYVDKITNVPWFNGRLLKDPLKYLGEDDRNALRYWLKNLQENIRKHITDCDLTGDTLCHGLFTALKEFVEEIEKMGPSVYLEGEQGGIEYSLSDKIYENFKIDGGIYNYLKKPLKMSDVVSTDSDVMILASRPGMGEILLLVDPNLESEWGKSAQLIKVFGTYTLEGAKSVLINVNDRDKKYGGLSLPEGTRIKLSNGIFTERLAVVKQGGAFPGSPLISIDSIKKDDFNNPIYAYDAITPIIPLSKDILQIISSEEIAKRVHFKIHSDDKAEVITVYFKLPLKGGEYTVYKKYSPDFIDKIEGVPVVEMWPDFVEKSGKWKPYYCLYSKNRGDITLSLEPNVPAEEFKFDDSRTHRKYSDGRLGSVPYNTDGWIKMTSGFPDLMKVEYQDKAYGAILLKKPRAVNVLDGTKWIFSIDFGTTSTKVGKKEGNRASSFSFTSLPFSITNSGAARGELMPEYFLPESDIANESNPSIPSMFQTIYHDFKLVAITPHPDPLVPFLNGHIYYRTRDEFDAVAPGIKSNLKWGNDIELIKKFLAQVMLQCTAEAVKNGVHLIEWRYSYPKALPNQTKIALGAIFDLISKKINQTTGISSSNGNSILSTTEGIAAGLYFKSVGRFGHEAVCVDIGGGTTDITFWKGSRLVYESSFKLAGRNLFLDLLFRNVNVLRKLGCDNDDVVMLEDLVKNKTELEFYAQIDALLKKQSDKFAETLPTCTINNVSEVMEFCDHVTIGLAGLFYYIGLTLKHLKSRSDKSGSPIPVDEIEGLLPNMFFGGNGAKLFGWAGRGSYNQQHDINKLFKTMLISAMGSSPKEATLSISIDSKNLKSEAANGLLYLGDGQDVDNIRVNEEYDNSVFAGGNFFNNTDVKQDEFTLLTTNMFSSGIQISTELINLRMFIDKYNATVNQIGLGMKPIDTNNELINRACSNIKGTLEEYIGKEPGDIPLEPLFIISLRSLLHELAEQWMDKHAQDKNHIL